MSSDNIHIHVNPVCLYNPLLSPPLSYKTFQKNYLHSLPSLHPHYLGFCPHHFTEQILPRSLITLPLFSPMAGSQSWSHLIRQQPLTPPSTPSFDSPLPGFLPCGPGPSLPVPSCLFPLYLMLMVPLLESNSGLGFGVPTSCTLQTFYPSPWLCFIRYLFLFFHYLLLLMQQHMSDLLTLPCRFLRLCVYHFYLIFVLSVLQIGSFLLIFKFTDLSSVISLLLLRWPCEFLILDLTSFQFYNFHLILSYCFSFCAGNTQLSVDCKNVYLRKHSSNSCFKVFVW